MKNTTRRIRAVALCALFLNAAAFGTDINSPWAWWKPDPASASSTEDATGNGHTLSHPNTGFAPTANEAIRGNHYALGFTGGNSAQFSCPVMRAAPSPFGSIQILPSTPIIRIRRISPACSTVFPA